MHQKRTTLDCLLVTSEVKTVNIRPRNHCNSIQYNSDDTAYHHANGFQNGLANYTDTDILGKHY